MIQEWLAENTLTKPSEHLEKTIIDLSSPIKREIFFGCEKVDALDVLLPKQRTSLLEELKWLNTTRNKVIHSGYNVGPKDARRGIRAAGLLLRVLWVHKQQQTFRTYGVGDIFSNFESQIRNISF